MEGAGVGVREKWAPLLFTVIVMGAIIWWTTSYSSKSEPQNPLPDTAVWRLVQACREGDVAGYLDCFEASLQQKVERLVQEQGSERFRRYLKQLVAPVKGIVTFAPQRDAEGNWRVVTEFVFADRTEQQVFLVRKVRGVWKIVGVETAKSVPVLVPYGTPVKGL